MGRWTVRAAVALIGCVAGVLAFAGVAFAHVEVSADPAVSGATNAVVTFKAEAESPTSGVVSVRIVLPTGLTANDVSLNKGPEGWAFTPGADGYTVAGPALPQGEEAIHSIIVTRLPNMTSLTFKAVVTYADGTADHWVDDTTAANPDPPHPAPVLALGGGTAASTPPASVTASATPAAEGSDLTWLWWLIGVIVVAGVALGVLLGRRRRDGASRS
jgi:Domain of unkown function (DUF1775)